MGQCTCFDKAERDRHEMEVKNAPAHVPPENNFELENPVAVVLDPPRPESKFDFTDTIDSTAEP